MTKLKLEGGRNNSNPFVIIEKSICFFLWYQWHSYYYYFIINIIIIVSICLDVRKKGKDSLVLPAPEQLSAPQCEHEPQMDPMNQ